MSPSAAKFSMLVSTSGATNIAKRIECDESAVRKWATGKRIPSPAWREKIAMLDSAIKADGWDAKAKAPLTAPAKESARVVVDIPTPILVPVISGDDDADEASGEKSLEEIIGQCDALYTKAMSVGSLATLRDLTTILTTKANAAARLARLRGDDAVSTRMIFASKEWGAIKEAVFGVLDRHPDVLREVVASLGRIERPSSRET